MTALLLVLLMPLLSGCGEKSAADKGLQTQQHWETLDSAQFETKIVSNLEQSTLEYTLEYCYNKEDSDVFTITEPEALRGIQATIAGGDTAAITLQYDGTELDAPGPTRAGVTPADVVPYLLRSLRSGSPAEAWEERADSESYEVLKFISESDEGTVTQQIWLRDSIPVRAEVYADGTLALTLTFANWT